MIHTGGEDRTKSQNNTKKKTWKDEEEDNKGNWGKYNFRKSEIGEKE